MIWEANKNYVDKHNKHADVFGFTLAMNKFADMVCTIYLKNVCVKIICIIIILLSI